MKHELWEPQFDAMNPLQEELAIQFSMEIAGKRGEKCSPPDAVRLLEMAESLYRAERDDYLAGMRPSKSRGTSHE